MPVSESSDVSSPSNPTEAGFCDSPDYANTVAITDTLAYVADESAGLRVVDISDVANPVEVGYYQTPVGHADWR